MKKHNPDAFIFIDCTCFLNYSDYNEKIYKEDVQQHIECIAKCAILANEDGLFVEIDDNDVDENKKYFFLMNIFFRFPIEDL